MYALVDCNNFYVSCERVFNPSLSYKPIVVLSNNNGCIIARSNEAKALNIPMGAPLHLYKEIIRKNNVIVYSSNYTLYGDMSSRVMNSFNYFVPDVEVYSIDEAFLNLQGFDNSIIYQKMVNMRKKVYQWTGIPVSIGLGPTKTLAKLANKIAKKYSDNGIYQITVSDQLTKILNDFNVEDIWGISKGCGNRLKKVGIYTALQLQRANPRHIRNCLSVVGERIVYELRGYPNLYLENDNVKKSITVSRSFENTVDDLPNLKKALANYIFRAAEKLRFQKGLCSGLCVFINTNRYRKKDLQYSNKGITIFDEPTNDTSLMIRRGFEVLQGIYRVKHNYKKIGVTLINFTINNKELSLKFPTMPGEKLIQGNLFSQSLLSQKKSNKFMKILDNINYRMGAGTIFYGSQGIKINLKNKKISGPLDYYKSKSFTTNWQELPKVN